VMGTTAESANGSRQTGEPPAAEGRSTFPWKSVAPLLVDIVVPIAAYYVLRGVGTGQVAALILGAVPTAVFAVYQAVRDRKVDALGAFVLVIIAVSTAMVFVTGSPRFLLAKEGWFTGAVGVSMLGSMLLGKPLGYRLARSMLERTPLGARLHTEVWEQLWERERWFRRAWHIVTAIWGIGTLADAVLRVIMAYALPVDTVPGLGGALTAVTFVGLQVVQQIYFVRVGLWQRLRDLPDDGLTEAEPPSAQPPSV
jgi:intracellular septation protein A